MKIIAALIASVVIVTGCRSRVTNVPASRDSEMGRAIAGMDAAQRQYQKNVALYYRAMTAYEKGQGQSCGEMAFSRLSPAKEVIGARVRIHELQGSSRRCGYQDYRVKITYADEACRIVETVEVLGRIAK